MQEIKIKIDRLLREHNKTQNALCEAIGLTASGYIKMWNEESVKYKVLERIAEYFNISVVELVSPPNSTVNEPKGNYVPLSKYNKVLEELVQYQKTDIERLKNTSNVSN